MALAALLASSGESQIATPSPAESLWLAARGQADGDSALFLFELLLARHARSRQARLATLEIADLHYARGAYAEALRHYESAGSGPLGERARLGAARSRYALGEYAAARQAAAALLRSADPRLQWEAGFLSAAAWQAEGRTREALSEYLRLLERPAAPAEPAALLAAARAARAEGRRDLAERLLSTLARRHPESFEALEADTVRAAAAPAGAGAP
jgi:tetratricopeptide (TPR) repeat protein